MADILCPGKVAMTNIAGRTIWTGDTLNILRGPL